MWNRSAGSAERGRIPGMGRFGPADEDLMDRLATDDIDALDELIHRHWGAVVDFAARTVGCGDSAEDLAQEAFIALWEGRREWAGESRARPLLLRMVRNRSLNEGRRQAVRGRLEAKVRNIETARRAPNPLEELKAKELESAFRQALDALSPRKREIFTLARFQGLSYAEIAEVLGISSQTVANQMSAVLQDLREALRLFDVGPNDSSSRHA